MSALSYHAAVILRSALDAFAASSTVFGEAANADGNWPAATLTDAHAALFPSASSVNVAINVRFSVDQPSRACIWVESREDVPSDNRPFGNLIAGTSGGQPMRGLLASETLVLYVYHQAEEVMLVLSSALRSWFMAADLYFLQNRYNRFDWQGSGPPSLEEQVTNGWLDVSLRTITFVAGKQIQIRDRVAPVVARDIVILPTSKTNPDDIQGGVSPEVVS